MIAQKDRVEVTCSASPRISLSLVTLGTSGLRRRADRTGSVILTEVGIGLARMCIRAPYAHMQHISQSASISVYQCEFLETPSFAEFAGQHRERSKASKT